MSNGVLCTFALSGASSTDYQNAYADLEKPGLYRAQDNSKVGNGDSYNHCLRFLQWRECSSNQR